MKHSLCVCLLILACVVSARSLAPPSPDRLGAPHGDTLAAPSARELLIWAEGLRLPPRRQRPWRPLLPRPVRRRLYLRVRRLRKRQRRAALKRQRESPRKRWRSRNVLLILGGIGLACVLLYLLGTVWRVSWRHGLRQAIPLIGFAGVVGHGQKAVVYSERRHYQPEFDRCLFCGEQLKSHRHLNWRKPIQMLTGNAYVTSRGRYCPCHPALSYLSAEAAHLSLPHSTYGLDVLVRIGYLRDYEQKTYAQIHADLPSHIRVSERHVSNLYREYLALLACAEQLDVAELVVVAAEYGGLIISVDALQPEGGQPQLWVVREVLTGTLLAAGWIPRVNDDTIAKFLAPVAALNLPVLATVSDKQRSLINALEKIWPDVPHQYCQAHYLSNAMTPVYKEDGHYEDPAAQASAG